MCLRACVPNSAKSNPETLSRVAHDRFTLCSLAQPRCSSRGAMLVRFPSHQASCACGALVGCSETERCCVFLRQSPPVSSGRLHRVPRRRDASYSEPSEPSCLRVSAPQCPPSPVARPFPHFTVPLHRVKARRRALRRREVPATGTMAPDSTAPAKLSPGLARRLEVRGGASDLQI